MSITEPQKRSPKICVLIPARGGSKGIPNKNLKSFCGKPLIAWTIEQALSSEIVEKVYVSTDSPEIAKIAREFGAEVPFLRPADISTDESSTEEAIEHFYNWTLIKDLKFDVLILLQATSPIRYPGSISAAVEKYQDSKFDSLVGVCERHFFTWYYSHNGDAKSSYDIFNRPRRQDIEGIDKTFTENGSIYVFSVNGFAKNKNRLFGKIGLFEMSEAESYEIDSNFDFEFCEYLMSKTLGLVNVCE